MKKLKLKKDLIANLSDKEMQSVKGGDTIMACTSIFVYIFNKTTEITSQINCNEEVDDTGAGGHTVTCNAGNNSGCDC